jgi:hypothetical protein
MDQRGRGLTGSKHGEGHEGSRILLQQLVLRPVRRVNVQGQKRTCTSERTGARFCKDVLFQPLVWTGGTRYCIGPESSASISPRAV